MNVKSKKIQAYEAIKKMIVSRQISYGEPMTELRLTEMLSVGRTPIREALNLLSRDGVVTLVPNKGFILNQIKYEDLIDIYRIREALDPVATRYAAQRIELSKLEEIEKKYLNNGKDDIKKGRVFSYELHSLIYESCGNPHLIEIFEKLKMKIQMSQASAWEFWSRIGDSSVPERRYHEHIEIIRLLKERDAEEAEKVSKAHISRTIQDVVRLKFGDYAVEA
jgi:DNA-binding GntR family transcriptional regulator